MSDKADIRISPIPRFTMQYERINPVIKVSHRHHISLITPYENRIKKAFAGHRLCVTPGHVVAKNNCQKKFLLTVCCMQW